VAGLVVAAVGGFEPAAAMAFVAAMVVLTACGYELHRRAIGVRPGAEHDEQRPRSD